MRAIVVNELGGPEVMVLGEQPEPVAGPGQVVVQVAAAGVNFIDIYRRSGVYKQPVPYIPGSEGAGTVVAVGEGVHEFAAGDHVAWSEGPGSYAEFVAIAAENAVPVPAGIDLKLAGAVMLQGLTAHYLCRSTFPVGEGTIAVVHAAAGGVGLLLTQMIKDLGGTVVATTSSTVKAALAKEAGADFVTTYEEFPAVVREVTGGRGADAVFDGVGKATPGLTRTSHAGGRPGAGARSVPIPPMKPARPSTQTGMSAPNSAATRRTRSPAGSSPQRRASPRRQAAASAEPPPIPEATGRFLTR